MKLRIAIIALLFTVFTVSAQKKKTVESSAKNNTAEMTKVLSLNEEQSAEIYEINLEKFKILEAIRKDKSLDKVSKKAKSKEAFLAAGQKFSTVVGHAVLKKWFKHNKEKRNK